MNFYNSPTWTTGQHETKGKSPYLKEGDKSERGARRGKWREITSPYQAFHESTPASTSASNASASTTLDAASSSGASLRGSLEAPWVKQVVEGWLLRLHWSTQVTPTFQPSAPDLANCHNVVQMRSCKTSRTPTSFRHLHCFNFFQHQVVKLSSTVYLPTISNLSIQSTWPGFTSWSTATWQCRLLDPTKGRSISPSQQPSGTKLTPTETKMQAENDDFQLGIHGISSSRGLYMQKPLQSHPTMASTSTIGIIPGTEKKKLA